MTPFTRSVAAAAVLAALLPATSFAADGGTALTIYSSTAPGALPGGVGEDCLSPCRR
jgi:hypothetical protein